MSETLTQIEEPGPAQEWFLGLAGLAFVMMAGAIYAYGQFGPALTAGLDVACAEAAFNSGKKLEEQGNYEQAVRRYRQAMEGRFQAPEQRYMCGRSIGDLLYRQNRYTEAIDSYRALPPEAFAAASAYPGYVNSLRLERRFSEARTLALEWLAKSEAQNDTQQQLWAHGALMRIALELGDVAEAVRHAEMLIGQDPASDAHLVLARIRARQGDAAAANALLEGFLKHSDDLALRDQALRLKRELETAAP